LLLAYAISDLSYSNEYLLLAVFLMTEIAKTDNWTTAASALEKALQQSPHDLQLHYQLGLCQFKLGNFKSAADHFKQVLQAEPAALDAQTRAHIYNDWAVCLFHSHNLEAAAERLHEALSINPDLLEAKLNLGLVEAGLSEHEHSHELLSDCLKTDPDNAEAHLYQGVAYLFEGKGQQATEEFNIAAGNGLSAAQLHLWPGYAQLAVGNAKDAAAIFEQHLSKNPGDYRALDALGCALLLLGNTGDAISKFEEALKINRQFAIARWHLAGAQLLQGETAQAKNNYTQALNLDAGCLDAEKNVLEHLTESGDHNLATDLVTRLLEVVPQDADLQLAQARILIALDKLDEAEPILQKLITSRPLNFSARALLGHVYFSQSRLAEADEQYRVATELGGDDSSIFLGWGQALSQLGLSELAVEKFQKAAQIDPFNPDVYDHWGSTLKELGRFTEAAQVYKQASDYIF
jgi:tetratricopeptide (TPR) repeat protein